MCNGEGSTHNICYINEHRLMKRIILDAPSDQKTFNILDIGAGECRWAVAMAKYLNEQADLPDGINVNIISVTGGQYFGERIVRAERCTLYNLDTFKIEELAAKLIEEMFNWEYDLEISNWCFRHLADPAGTFVQAYNLLRPGKGLLLFDGFEFLYDDEKLNKHGANDIMTRMLLDTNAPFVTVHDNYLRSMNHFLLKRPDAAPCRLPMNYLEMITVQNAGSQIFSKTKVRFKRAAQEGDDELIYVPQEPHCKTDRRMSGDKKLHDWVKRNELFSSHACLWAPLKDRYNVKERPPLHQARNLDEVKSYLSAGHLIDESDFRGETPLHLAVKTLNWELFDLLLLKGANIRLYNSAMKTPLHEAAALDKEGRFIKRLLALGADVNATVMSDGFPINAAIQSQNLAGLEILLNAQAKLSKKHLKLLNDPAFSSLRERGLIPAYTEEYDIDD